MKKLLCAILALVIFLSLTSCDLSYEGNETLPPDRESDFEIDGVDDSEKKPEESNEPTLPTDKEENEPKAPTLAIKGEDISKYKIVYSSALAEKVKDEAKRLAEHFKNAFGIEVCIVVDPDEAIEKTIALSDTLPEGGGNLKADSTTAIIQDVNGSVWITATNKYTIKAAIDKIIADATPTADKSDIDLDYSGNKGVNVKAEELGDLLKVMSYNIKNGSPTDDRIANTIKDITDFDPDTVGMQEVHLKWMNIFRDNGLLEEYELVGEQRFGAENPTANNNEASSILYKKSKFNLIDSGTYWLSDTPSVPNTKLADSEYVRIMTYVVLERKSDGVRFAHVNTHLSWGSDLNLRQMEILVSLVNEKIYSKYGELPTYFTGDFNVSISSKGCVYLLSVGTEDSRAVAEVTSNEGTSKSGSIIDYCIVTKNDFFVASFDVGCERPGDARSDHYPVYVEMYFVPKK